MKERAATSIKYGSVSFLVEAGAHVVDGRLEARVEDGVVERVGRGRQQRAQQRQRVAHAHVAVALGQRLAVEVLRKHFEIPVCHTAEGPW